MGAAHFYPTVATLAVVGLLACMLSSYQSFEPPPQLKDSSLLAQLEAFSPSPPSLARGRLEFEPGGVHPALAPETSAVRRGLQLGQGTLVYVSQAARGGSWRSLVARDDQRDDQKKHEGHVTLGVFQVLRMECILLRPRTVPQGD